MFDPKPQDIMKTVVAYRKDWMKPKDWEFGVVKSFNDEYVHVLYGRDSLREGGTAKATKREDLTNVNDINLMVLGDDKFMITTVFAPTYFKGYIIDKEQKSLKLKTKEVNIENIIEEASKETLIELMESLSLLGILLDQL